VLGYAAHVSGTHELPPSVVGTHWPFTHDDPAAHVQAAVRPPQPSLCCPHWFG
jgi:hypothetical protein